MNRDNMLAQLRATDHWDIIIIGGGATGLGCATDAASRGLKTLLVEQYDFAKGTSSRATKLVHGGVRYLEQGNIKLVREALRERAYLLRNAPHITSVLGFITPVYRWWDKWYYGIGLKLYDFLSGTLSLGKTQWLNKSQTAKELTGINTKNLKGGILYFDGQFDDARLAIDLARTAVQHGATVLNYCQVSSLTKANGKINGVVVKDEINQTSYTAFATCVINATGVFADAVMQMDEPGHTPLVSPSQGIHLVADASFFPSSKALLIPKTSDGRVLFFVPWHNKVIIGTTDTPVAAVNIEPKPLEEEIAFLLHHANLYLAKTMERKDVRSVFTGLRPLIKQKGAANTSILSRDHTMVTSESGLITVSGGKWTTYRKMAEDVMNQAIHLNKMNAKPCITKRLRIASPGLKQHGDLSGLGFSYTKENIRYFVREEMAMRVEDILARRTRLLFLDAKAAVEIAPAVAKRLAEISGKDEQWVNYEINVFTRLAKQYLLPPAAS